VDGCLEQRMGRIHRYGQTEDCLIFNFVATNTIEGHVLRRLLVKLQEIRDALDDDAVFNVVGELLPAAHIERVLRDYYASRLGDADLEDRLLRDVDEGRFRAICRNALEGLATKKLNLEMLIERRARAQERRVVPETLARFLADAAEFVPLTLRPVAKMAHAFDPARTPSVLRRYESEPDWKLPRLADKYPRCSTDRDTADKNHLEWVTPGHPLFEAVRRHTLAQARPELARGACYHSLRHDRPTRLDFYRARVVDGLGQVVHERSFAVEVGEGGSCVLQDPSVLGNLTPAPLPADLPAVAEQPEPTAWLHEHALRPFLDEVRTERLAEVERIASHVELSLTELLQHQEASAAWPVGCSARSLQLDVDRLCPPGHGEGQPGLLGVLVLLGQDHVLVGGGARAAGLALAGVLRRLFTPRPPDHRRRAGRQPRDHRDLHGADRRLGDRVVPLGVERAGVGSAIGAVKRDRPGGQRLVPVGHLAGDEAGALAATRQS
jgi:hypothetical protein